MTPPSLLSRPAILRYLERGDIIIDPFVPENLGTAQYDVTLGPHYYRYDSTKVPMPLKGGTKIYNPFDEEVVLECWKEHHATTLEEQNLHPEFSFGRELASVSPDDRVIFVYPGETILAHTQEFIGGACDRITTMMKARSSAGRNFIEVCKCAGQGDIGYFNRWTMEITNNNPTDILLLVVGRRLAQIVFFETEPLGTGPSYELKGKYQTVSGLAALRESWQPSDMLPKQWLDREARK